MCVFRNEVSLKITEPIITSYSPYAFLFSILPCYQNTEGWIYNNFINLWGQREAGDLAIRFSSWYIMEICPFISYNILSQDFIKGTSSSIIEFLISAISSNYYIYLPCDFFYIPGTNVYKKYHFRHPSLIYGFDLNRKTFKVADFLKDFKFDFVEIPFDCINMAANKVLDIKCPEHWKSDFAWHDVAIFKFKENQNYHFDMRIVANSFKNLINSEHSTLPFENNILGEGEKPAYQEDKMFFGLKNYIALNDALLENKIENLKNKFTDMRAFHALYDHKVYIISLIRYLGKNNFLNKYEFFIERYTNLKIDCLKNRNLFIKYLINNKIDIIDVLVESNLKIFMNEKKILEDLLNNICYII